MAHSPHINEWYKKEFIYEMQAKGRLPRYGNESSDRRDKAYNLTTDRIFPTPAHMMKDAALYNMIARSETRIQDTLQAAGEPPGGPDSIPVIVPHKRDLTQRHILKAKVLALEQEVRAERTARERMEREAALFKAEAGRERQ